jgi:competence protein ComEC
MRLRVLLVAVCLAVLSAPVLAQPVFVEAPLEGKVLKVQIVDVGQGDCLLVESPEGKRMLIDAGAMGRKNRLMDFLKERGVTELEQVLVSHSHADHLGKMQKVLQTIKVGRVISNGYFHTTGINLRVLEAMKERSIPMKVVAAGDTFKLGEGVEFQVLHPEKGADLEDEDVNNTSLVVKLTYGDVSFMLTGDAEHDTEAQLLDDHLKDLDADVLKVGHHGSQTACGNRFLNAVSPTVAIISCGLNNRYAHPRQKVLDALAKHGSKLFRTDQEGTITITTDGKKIHIDQEKPAPTAVPDAA